MGDKWIQKQMKFCFPIFVLAIRCCSQEPGAAWYVHVRVEADFPSGTSARVKAELVYPAAKDATVDCTDDECNGLTISARHADVRNPPSHVIMKLSAYTFKPQIVNTGVLQWHPAYRSKDAEEAFAYVKAAFTAPAVPKIERIIKLTVDSPGITVLEITIYNPTNTPSNITALRMSSVIANHFVSCLSASPFTLFSVRLKVDAARITGTIKRRVPHDSYGYMLHGDVRGVCGQTVRLGGDRRSELSHATE